jgi:hypothetical protein
VITLLVICWLSFFAYLVAKVNAHIDAIIKITYRKQIKHWTRFVVRVLLMSGSSAIVFKWVAYDIYLFFSMLAYSGFLFWIEFELTYNKLIKQPTLFVGTTSDMDKLQRWLFGSRAGEIVFVIKVILLVTTFATTYYLLMQ